MLGSGLNLVTTVIGFGMSATFIVFVCARLICGRVRSDEDSHSTTIDIELGSDLDMMEHANHGLEPIAVSAIPTVKYSHEAFKSREDAQCSICLADYQEKEILRLMPRCSHNFHIACIDEWLQKQSTCPVCRMPLHDTFEASPVCDSPTYHSNQWLLPTSQRSSDNHTNQQLHNSVSVNIEVSPNEQASRT